MEVENGLLVEENNPLGAIFHFHLSRMEGFIRQPSCFACTSLTRQATLLPHLTRALLGLVPEGSGHRGGSCFTWICAVIGTQLCN